MLRGTLMLSRSCRDVAKPMAFRQRTRSGAKQLDSLLFLRLLPTGPIVSPGVVCTREKTVNFHGARQGGLKNVVKAGVVGAASPPSSLHATSVAARSVTPVPMAVRCWHLFLIIRILHALSPFGPLIRISRLGIFAPKRKELKIKNTPCSRDPCKQQ